MNLRMAKSNPNCGRIGVTVWAGHSYLSKNLKCLNFIYKLDENEFWQQLDGYMYNIRNESLFSGLYYIYASCRNCNGLYK